MILYMHPFIGNGRATAAIDVSDKTNIRVAFAFCSPKDQFSRKKGRLIATGRVRVLEDAHIEFEDDGEQAIKAQVMSHLEDDMLTGEEYLPQWARYRGLYRGGE